MVKIPDMPPECYEDLMVFGAAFYRVDENGKTIRVDPKDVQLKREKLCTK